MTNDVSEILKVLQLPSTGHYDNDFYIIDLANSNEYAKMYTLLEQNAVNTEYPGFGVNSTGSVVKVTNYFELDQNNVTYNIFLIGDFDADKYYIKIGEK